MSKASGLSMRWKLVLASVLVEVVMLAMLVWNGLRLMDETLQKQSQVRLQEISVLLNASLGPALASQDYAPIADVFRQSRRSDGIQYFLLTDPQGKVLLADGWDLETPPPPEQPEINLGTQEKRFDTRIPITLSGQIYGQLHFGVSTSFLHEARQHLGRQSLSIAALEILLSIALLSALAIWLTRHLRRLQQASEAVGKGQFNFNLNIESNDEVGQLASTFNQMTQKIEQQLKALRNSEARFKSLLNLSTDHYWEQDSDFRFSVPPSGSLNNKFQHVAEWLRGQQRWELKTTLTTEQWTAHRAQLEAHESFRRLEYGLYFPDGSLRYFQVHGEPFFDNAGAFAGYRGTANDITQRKLAEDSLRLSASVFAEAHEGIIITAPNWQIIDLNPMASELTGFGRSELLGQDLRLQYVDDDTRRFQDEIAQTLHEQGHWRGEVTGTRKGGSHFPEQLTASAVRNLAGETTNYIFIFSDSTALKEHQAKLEAMAHYDSLTRLPNRALLADRMQQSLQQAKRMNELLAVAYLDLDGFKPVNDNFGHDAGDALLIEVANRLRSTVRSGDTVARLGGDEFALLLRADDFGECEAALLRVLGALSSEYRIKGQNILISASIGVTLYPNDTSEPDVLLRHADQAMYVAKQAGRNRYHFFDADLDHKMRSEHAQISRIQSALLAEEFVLFYQPKVDMRNGRITGAEALIRWQHPEQGLLPPGEFLPLIDNTETIVTLGDWVIEQALKQMAIWQKMGLTVPISVNIAARQFQAETFVARLKELLSLYRHVPPSWLELEIVETAALDDIIEVSNIIRSCEALGVSFALDDFGTGYSSLTYFKRLPARTLKIDQSFIRDMLADPEDLAIVEGIIGLAKAFQRTVIAEGVETAAHGCRLMQMGCYHAQGYGIARPMPANQLPGWIENFRPDPSWIEQVR